MIVDLVETLLQAAASQLIVEPPFDRVFSTHMIGCAYYVATGGDPRYLPLSEVVRKGRDLARREWWRR